MCVEFFEIIIVIEVWIFFGLFDCFGCGKGCDICKFVVVFILVFIGFDYILDGE